MSLEIMPLGERMRVSDLASEAYDRGDMVEYLRLSNTVPLEPETAILAVKLLGREKFLEKRYNLTLANSALGDGWLDRYDGSKRLPQYSGNYEEIQRRIHAILQI